MFVVKHCILIVDLSLFECSENTDLRRASGSFMFADSEKISLLLQWCQVVCTLYNIEVKE